jgi:hypothetical protein
MVNSVCFLRGKNGLTDACRLVLVSLKILHINFFQPIQEYIEVATISLINEAAK